MTEYGIKIVCDRCGREEFLKKLGEKLTDGGFTKCDEYEKYPEDWDKVHGKDLCSVCNDKYKRMIERFYSDLDWDCGIVTALHFDAHLNDVPADAFKNLAKHAECAANMIEHMQVDG